MRRITSMFVLAFVLAALPVAADVTPPVAPTSEIPKCPGRRKTMTVDQALAFAKGRFDGVGSTIPIIGAYVRGLLRFDGEVCTAGVPPYCTGTLSLTPGRSDIDRARLIHLDGSRIGLPTRCGMTMAAANSPARSDCAPGLLDREVEVRGSLSYTLSFEPRATLIADSICRR